MFSFFNQGTCFILVLIIYVIFGQSCVEGCSGSLPLCVNPSSAFHWDHPSSKSNAIKFVSPFVADNHLKSVSIAGCEILLQR